jgi:DNA processing protein
MNKKQIIALQRLISIDEMMSYSAACKHSTDATPKTASQTVQVMEALHEQGILKRSYAVSEVQKALSEADRIIDESEEQDIEIITYFDDSFPEPLRHIKQKNKYACPLVLYYKGKIRNVNLMEAIAIIGTRRPTDDGLKMGEYYGEYFADQGFNIVSGLAAGCDTAAHRGALKAHGITTAFLAHGLDMVHTSQNKSLAERIIATGGVLVSEYPAGTPVSSQNLVERNRLQAGLADALILIQTDIKKGGSMHAVNTAIENGKPVFAVRFDSMQANAHPMSLGNCQLIDARQATALRPDNKEEVIRAIDIKN